MSESSSRPAYINEGVLITYDKLIRRGLIDPKQAERELRFRPPVAPKPAEDWRSHVDKQISLHPLAESMGRAVARGTLAQDMAAAILRAMHPDCPVGLSVSAVARMISTARQHAADRDAAENRVRRAVWPLIEARRLPGEVGQAAMAVAAPLRRWEVVAICQDIVIRTKRRGRHRAR